MGWKCGIVNSFALTDWSAIHYLLSEYQVSGMKPVFGPPVHGTAAHVVKRIATRGLVIVVRKDEVLPAKMKVHALVEDFAGQRAALDVPS